MISQDVKVLLDRNIVNNYLKYKSSENQKVKEKDGSKSLSVLNSVNEEKTSKKELQCTKINNESYYIVSIEQYCKKCDKSYSGLRKRKHDSQIKCSDCESPLSYRCSKCKKSDNYQTAWQHVRSCVPKYYFKCNQCDYKSEKILVTKNHIQLMHYDQDKKVVSDSKENFTVVRIMETPDSDFENLIQLRCLYCEKDYDQKRLKNYKNCPDCESLMEFQCTKCKKGFTDYRRARMHVISFCLKIYNFKCKKCDYECSFKDSMMSHIKRRHTVINKKDYSKCTKCGKEFKIHANMLMHQRRCGSNKIFKCTLCPYATKYAHDYRRHLRNHVAHTKVKDIQCSADFKNITICENSEQISPHEKENSLVNDNFCMPKVQIVSAQTTFKDTKVSSSRCNLYSDRLYKSERLMAFPIIEFYCKECGHSQNSCEKNPVKCVKCGKKNRIYRCRKCPKVHRTFSEICRHVKIEHLLDEQHLLLYQCGNCARRFTFYKSVRRHYKLCTKDEKNFKCNDCNFAAKSKYSVSNHIKTQHMGLSLSKKRYKCQKCEAKFLTAEFFEAHVKRGCNTIYYWCDECDKKFKSKISLIAHMKAKEIK